MEKNKYVFRVARTANKRQIKIAVEEAYSVTVKKVWTINVKGKMRQLGRTTGWKPGYKKAVVELKAGQTIEILPH